jgi:DeoR family fructose operon transcriptional repressor
LTDTGQGLHLPHRARRQNGTDHSGNGRRNHMLPQERYRKIVEYLQNHDIIKIDQMTEMFDVSVETVRRDLTFLAQEGVIRKVYGGAALIRSEAREAASAERMKHALDEKVAIAQKCVEFIEDGDWVLLGVGTTTLQVARALKARKDLTIISSSIHIIAELLDTDFDLYMIGGKIRAEEGSVSGALSLLELDNLRIGKAIIGTGGITVTNGLSDYNMEEALLRRKAVEQSYEVIVVADHSKFGKDVLTKVCPIDDVSLIITDRGLPHEEMEELRRAGVRFVLA